jgi:predicted nucleotidyltransferase
MAQKMYPDFLELLRVLEKHKVAYALIGGYAVGIHAEPRATKDLDLVVAPTPKNAKALLKALKEFGAPIDNLSEQDLVKPGLLYVFGVPPLRVDILNSLKGVDVMQIVKKAKRVKLGDTTLKVIDIDDLIHVKTLAGRPQDKVDVKALKKVKTAHTGGD